MLDLIVAPIAARLVIVASMAPSCRHCPRPFFFVIAPFIIPALPCSLPSCNLVNLSVVLVLVVLYMGIHGPHRRHCDNCVSIVLASSPSCQHHPSPPSFQHHIIIAFVVAALQPVNSYGNGCPCLCRSLCLKRVAICCHCVVLVFVIASSIDVIVSASHQRCRRCCSLAASSISTLSLSL